MTHKNRNWQRRWTVDLEAQTATHEDGWVFQFDTIYTDTATGDAEFKGRLIEQPTEPEKRRDMVDIFNQAWRAWHRAREGRH